jgi:hypothetical protein
LTKVQGRLQAGPVFNHRGHMEDHLIGEESPRPKIRKGRNMREDFRNSKYWGERGWLYLALNPPFDPTQDRERECHELVYHTPYNGGQVKCRKHD